MRMGEVWSNHQNGQKQPHIGFKPRNTPSEIFRSVQIKQRSESSEKNLKEQTNTPIRKHANRLLYKPEAINRLPVGVRGLKKIAHPPLN